MTHQISNDIFLFVKSKLKSFSAHLEGIIPAGFTD